MHHNFSGILWRIEGITLTPIVTDSICKDVSSPVECSCCDRTAHGRIAFKPVFSNSVPKVEGSVGASGAEGAVLRMEGDGVDGVDVGHVTLRRVAMTLEGKVGARILILNILNCTPPLNAADGKTVSLGKAAYDSGLPFEGTLGGFIEFGGLVEGDNVDVSVGRTNHEELSFYVHCVHALLTLDGRDGISGSQVPVLDGFVPRARNDHGRLGIGRSEILDAADRLIVHGDLRGRIGVGAEIDHACRLVGASPNDILAIRRPGTAQDGRFVFEESLARTPARTSDFVDAHLLIPRRYRQVLRLWRKGQVGNSIFGRRVESYVFGEVSERV